MSFIEYLAKASAETNNVSYTENGGLGYKTTGKSILDFFFKIVSYKNTHDMLVKDFSSILKEESKEFSLALALYLRDPRGGQGQRDSGRTAARLLMENKLNAEEIKRLMEVFPVFGRWDDVVSYITHQNKDISNAALSAIETQLTKDMASENPSLLGKWLPSVNTSSKKSVKLAHKILKHLKWNCEKYRKACVELRKKIAIVETKMSANEWNDINYEHVPSLANIRYKNAFEKHDSERRAEYIKKLEKGEVKIHGAVNYPHNIISRLRMDSGANEENSIILYDKLWKELPVLKLENTLTVVDVSGSMAITISGGTTAMDVSIALGLYTAENTKGEFHNKVITFSKTPMLCELPEANILDRYNSVKNLDWEMNTDIQAVFQLILKTAVDNKVKQDELPAQILIVTDMEFDIARGRDDAKNPFQKDFAIIENEFTDAGYKMPKLVFWNVASRTCTIPSIKPEVTLVSGFSPVTLELIANDVPIEQGIAKVLGKQKYAEAVRYVLSEGN